MKELTFSDAKGINGGDGGVTFAAFLVGVAGSLVGAFIWESIDDHEGTADAFNAGYNSTRR